MRVPNIVLIVIDTCREDLLSNAISKDMMPNLKSVLGDFNIFKQNISPSPWTTPSHVSLFTGLYPSEHKVHEDGISKQSSVIMEKIKTFDGKLLPETLREKGYSTYGFVANPNLMPGTGFERGFNYLFFSDMFSDLSDELDAFRERLLKRYSKDFDEILDIANNFSLSRLLLYTKCRSNILKLPYLLTNYLIFLNGVKRFNYPLIKGGDYIVANIQNSFFNEPYFIFVNFMETHDPYKISSGKLFSGEGEKMLRYLAGDHTLSESELSKFKSIYLDELSEIDKYLGKIIKKLKQSGSYDDSIFVITSDHGQSFGENHFYGHGVFVSDALVRVPLLLKLPQNKKITPSSGYQSLVNIYEFIVSCSNGILDSKLLTSDTVYSESFGIQEDYTKLFKRDINLLNTLKKLDHRRLAVYCHDSKMVLNINDKLATISKIGHPSTKEEESVSDCVENALRFLGPKFTLEYASKRLK